jgi:hypothetical protein
VTEALYSFPVELKENLENVVDMGKRSSIFGHSNFSDLFGKLQNFSFNSDGLSGQAVYDQLPENTIVV